MRLKKVVGIEINWITCPMCKTVKNSWQPYLPLGLDLDKSSDPLVLSPYIDFCSQLIIYQQNNAAFQYDPERNLLKNTLQKDIREDPERFLKDMMEVVTHLMLKAVVLKNHKLLCPFDPSSQ